MFLTNAALVGRGEGLHEEARPQGCYGGWDLKYGYTWWFGCIQLHNASIKVPLGRVGFTFKEKAPGVPSFRKIEFPRVLYEGAVH